MAIRSLASACAGGALRVYGSASRRHRAALQTLRSVAWGRRTATAPALMVRLAVRPLRRVAGVSVYGWRGSPGMLCAGTRVSNICVLLPFDATAMCWTAGGSGWTVSCSTSARPSRTRAYDFLVVMGAAADVWDHDKHPWTRGREGDGPRDCARGVPSFYRDAVNSCRLATHPRLQRILCTHRYSLPTTTH